MTKLVASTTEACGAAGANESDALEEAVDDTNSDSEKQVSDSASKMTIKKAVATADNARISLGGAVEATATKADKDNCTALGGASAAAVEDASATEQAKVRKQDTTRGTHSYAQGSTARLIDYTRILSRLRRTQLR